MRPVDERGHRSRWQHLCQVFFGEVETGCEDIGDTRHDSAYLPVRQYLQHRQHDGLKTRDGHVGHYRPCDAPRHGIVETLGHSNVGMTINPYAHVVPSLQRHAADRMDEVLRLGAS